jgi:hypothetical protein
MHEATAAVQPEALLRSAPAVARSNYGQALAGGLPFQDCWPIMRRPTFTCSPDEQEPEYSWGGKDSIRLLGRQS